MNMKNAALAAIPSPEPPEEFIAIMKKGQLVAVCTLGPNEALHRDDTEECGYAVVPIAPDFKSAPKILTI